MADESSTLRAARQKALAEKKRRLEEIKARRTNASASASVVTTEEEDVAAAAVPSSSYSSKKNNNINLDSYIDDLLKTSTPGLSLAAVSAEEEEEEEEEYHVADQVQAANEAPAAAAIANIIAPSSSATEAAVPAEGGVAAAATGTQPRAVETFEVAVQCEENDFPPPSLVGEDDDNNDDDADERGSDDDRNENDENVGVFPDKKSSLAQTSHPGDGNIDSTSSPVMVMSSEEKSKVLSSKPFAQFLSNASRRVERLLGSNDADVYGILKGSGWREGVARLGNNVNNEANDERGSAAGASAIDFSVDYANEDEDEDEDGQYHYDDDDEANAEEVTDGVSSSSDLHRHRRLRRRQGGKSSSQAKTEPYQLGGYFAARATYEFPKFTHGRHVTDIKWCPGHGEWVLASYNAVASSGGRGPVATASVGGDGATVLDGETGPVVGVGGLTWSRNNPTTRHLSPHDPPSSFLQKTAAAGGGTTSTTPSFSSSYHYTSSIPDEGIVAIYNLSMPSRPEHLFCAGCPILHSQYHPTEHPRLIVGGGSSGQVLVWDARAGRYPVQRSSASSGGGHNCELVGMKVLGDVGGGAASAGGGGGSLSTSKLVTASSDGKVNYWAVSNLREPVETVMVDANLSCLDVVHGDSANNESVVCGDERGGVNAIFLGSGRDGSSSNKRVIRALHAGGGMGLDPSAVEGDADLASKGVVDDLADMGHFGMVTSVSTRPVIPTHGTPRKGTTTSSKGFVRGVGGLMITTGVDWSTKLWAPAYYDRPLMSFLSNSYDYMCDAQW